MSRILRLLTFTLFFIASKANVYGQEEIAKPVRTVVQNIRNSKDESVFKYVDAEGQGRFLLGDDWTKATPAQRAEFTRLFQSIFAKVVFPKVRENFKNLASIIYDNPIVNGNEATVGSVIIIQHPMKKQEMKVKYIMIRQQKEWKLVDVNVLGNSMLTGVRDDQVRPLVKEGGLDRLLKAMREKEKELSRM